MTVEVSTVVLLDVARDEGVEAELRDAIQDAQLQDWEEHWRPALILVLAELIRRGVPRSEWPQSSHWDWPAKAAQMRGLLAFKGFSLVCDGLTQGLMRVDLNRTARLPDQRGKPLVYIDYLEVAPWNRSELGQPPRYKGVGSALVTAAVELSGEEGFKGRLGLHALPQADRFYGETCGMTDLGPDPVYQNRMRYFEMTPEQAKAFLPEERQR